MPLIKCINSEGGIEFLGSIELKHRPDCRPFIEGDGVPVKSVKMEEKRRDTVPDILHKIKSSATAKEVEAIMDEHGTIPEVKKVAARKIEELLASVQRSSPADELTSIKGIGTGTAKRLVEAGIDSFQKLAEAKPEDLRSIIPNTITTEAINGMQDAALALLS